MSFEPIDLIKAHLGLDSKSQSECLLLLRGIRGSWPESFIAATTQQFASLRSAPHHTATSHSLGQANKFSFLIAFTWVFSWVLSRFYMFLVAFLQRPDVLHKTHSSRIS